MTPMVERWCVAWRRAMTAALGDVVAEEHLGELDALVRALDDPEAAEAVARHLEHDGVGRALQHARDEYRSRVTVGEGGL